MAWLTAATSIIAVLAFADSVLTRYVRAKSRRYAAEHDFDIVRRELDSLKSVLDKVESDVSNLERSVAVIEAITRMKGGGVREPPIDVP
jgi:hypothetical protein